MNDNRGAKALRTLLESTTQVDLSKRTGISQSFLSRLASGEKEPKLRTQAIALAAVGIPIEWWDEPSPESPLPDSNHIADPAA